MKRPLNALAVFAVLIATCAVTAGANSAAAAQPPAPQAVVGAGTTVTISPDAWSSAGLAPGQLSVIVHLKGDPVWRVVDAAAKSGRPVSKDRVRAARRDLARRQAPLVRAVEAIGGRVIGRFTGGMNALHVDCTAAELKQIVALSGVVSVSKAPVHSVDNKDVGPWTGASRVVQELGWDGKDVTVAVIDTGIDYTHKDFGGSGDTAEFTANDPNTTDDMWQGKVSFPTEKVIGGVDLAGEFYSPGCQQDTPTCSRSPVPDDDPLDKGSGANHGTHVAGTAAGIGTDKVAPGMAPGANLVAIKVFGSPVGAANTTNLALEALEWIFNHNTNLDDPDADVPGHRPAVVIDVVNLSLGSEYGPGTAEYAEMTAALHQAGVTVVASAGNNGNVHYIAGSPAATEMILSVANSYANGETEQLFRANWTEGGQAMMFETGYVGDSGWLPPITTVLADKPLAFFGSACNNIATEPFQDVNEKFALIERGTCSFTEKVKNAQAKGAIGVVVFTGPTAKVPMGPTPPGPYPTIPAVMIDRDKGLQIRDLLQNGTPVKATIDPTKFVQLPWLTDTISNSSSRGPSRASGGIKPNITAPGENTFSALAGSGTNGISFSGTSMSGPAVAGIVALLAQRNREQELGLSAPDLAALAMNYAQPVIRLGRNDTGPQVGVTRQGAGRANAFDSATGSVLVRSDRGLAEFSLNDLNLTGEVGEAASIERELTVRNLTETSKHYKLSSMLAFPEEDADKGLAVSFPDELITLHSRDEQTVSVHFDLTPAKIRAWELFGLDGMAAAKEPIFRAHEIDGYVILTETNASGEPVADGEVLHVPFHALPHRRSCVQSTTNDAVEVPADGQPVDHLYQHPCQQPGPLSVAHLGGVDAQESAVEGSGMPSPIDIGALGVSTGVVQVGDGMGGMRDVPIVQFSLTTYGARRSPAPVGYKIYIDGDMDGTWDRVIFPFPEGAFAAGVPAGRHLVAWANVDQATLEPNFAQVTAAFLQSYDIGESVTMLAVPAADVFPGSDVAAGTLSFRYAAAVSDPFEDFAQTSSFLGDDMAPDTLVDGDGYTFDLATDGCLVMEEAVTGTADLFAPTAGLNFPPNAVAKTQLKNVCTDLEGAIDTGLLSVYRANKPDHAGWQTREVRIVADSSAIYLPYVSSLHVLEGHDVPTATPEPTSDAPPTEVPTADPSHPTSQPSVEPGPPTDEPRAPTAAP